MRSLAAFLILVVIAFPSHAGVIWDESVNGELSHAAAAPTLLPIAVGSNIINATVGNPGGLARDYFRFIVPEGHLVTAMNLLVFAPDDIAFAAINTGVHSYFPNYDTEIYYLAGIHVFQSDVGSDLLDRFSDRSVTLESLPASELGGPVSYCVVIQQTAVVITTYSIELVLIGPTATENTTWGKVKALYR
jgi:hypothetical protein